MVYIFYDLIKQHQEKIKQHQEKIAEETLKELEEEKLCERCRCETAEIELETGEFVCSGCESRYLISKYG